MQLLKQILPICLIRKQVKHVSMGKNQLEKLGYLIKRRVTIKEVVLILEFIMFHTTNVEI